jgi:hypothetical protein
MSSDDDFPSPGDDLPSPGDGIPEYKPEMDAWNRVGLPGGGLIGAVPQNRVERAMMDPLDRFRLYVDATSRNLNNWDGVDISEESIEKMLNSAARLKEVGHKNPTAYVLGFLATGGGHQISKKDFDYVNKKVLPHAAEGSVLPPDVVRYARLWETLK